MTYTPEWTREDRPTAGMKEAELIAYYKARSLEGDATFALRPGASLPIVIRQGWEGILTDLRSRKGKASPALKAEGKRLRNLTREWLGAVFMDGSRSRGDWE